MKMGDKVILVVGDRVLIRPDKPEERTKVGLYLPETVVARDPVQVGTIMATGPGVPVPNLSQDYGEPWQESGEKSPHYIPLQAKAGDVVLFLKKEAIDIRYQEEEFIVVPHSAILLLIRENE
jgi:chaperonin GroES